jgi:glycosyltransferase involved in cell wall biosynthesis
MTMDRNIITSVIIPCYNSGKYLSEAIESVLKSNERSYEVIIVDDGSTDVSTLDMLIRLELEGYSILRQKNSGPAAARNAGARIARGEFLFFLDSDNKLRAGYIKKGAEIMTARPEVGVVHANANFFGSSVKPRFKPQEFDMDSILLRNYIDMCALVRKTTWEEVAGFDENPDLIGCEDWEFWIRVGQRGWKFEYIDEVLFDYRIRENSLSTLVESERRTKTVLYISARNMHQLF